MKNTDIIFTDENLNKDSKDQLGLIFDNARHKLFDIINQRKGLKAAEDTKIYVGTEDEIAEATGGGGGGGGGGEGSKLNPHQAYWCSPPNVEDAYGIYTNNLVCDGIATRYAILVNKSDFPESIDNIQFKYINNDETSGDCNFEAVDAFAVMDLGDYYLVEGSGYISSGVADQGAHIAVLIFGDGDTYWADNLSDTTNQGIYHFDD